MNASVREQLQEMYPHPFWDLYGTFQTLRKLITTYVGKSKDEYSPGSIPGSVSPVDGRIHTNLKPWGAGTMRRSSSSPNLQNIPVRTPEGRMLRAAFIPAPGYKFVVADYKTAEVFVAAHLSQDPLMLQVFAEGKDIHMANACALFKTTPEKVTKNMRSQAKIFVFGVMYGGQPGSLARQMSTPENRVTKETAQVLYDNFFRHYEVFQTWRERQVESVIEAGYCETAYFFRRHIPWPEDYGGQKAAIRAIYDTPMQGTVAGHVARAYPRVQKALHSSFDGALIMEVHDELICEVREDQAEAFLPVMIEAMTFEIPSLGVAIQVDGEIRDRWFVPEE
jgi:DNA polymerase-1